jgi:hypothetical protein
MDLQDRLPAEELTRSVIPADTKHRTQGAQLRTLRISSFPMRNCASELHASRVRE